MTADRAGRTDSGTSSRGRWPAQMSSAETAQRSRSRTWDQAVGLDDLTVAELILLLMLLTGRALSGECGPSGDVRDRVKLDQRGR